MRHGLLFAMTVATVYTTGRLYYGGGIQLAIGILSILLAHEMGHYAACRYYKVDATLPFFIPAPPLLVGTFGALIRIRGPIPHRRALFDIGIAGPLAGFCAALPILALGVREARILPSPSVSLGPSFGEPLLFHWAVWIWRGAVPEGMSLYVGPWGMAAWFGLFVTALNLIPVGQLDGGHVIYALFRQRAVLLSRLAWWACVLLIYFGPNWVVWSALLLVIGRRHPPTLNDRVSLGWARVFVALIGLAVLAVCFVPDPIVGSWRELLEAVRALRG